jgi:hypothetical protein
MAYGNKYYFTFNNELQETYEVWFAWDGYAGAVTTVQASGNPIQLNYINNGESILEPLVTLEAIIQIRVPHNGTLTFEDFVTDRDDEIYVTIIKGGTHYLFEGWVVAEQGSQQFKDPPYIIELKCVDGLGLMKNAPLSNSLGVDFTGRQSLAAIVGGALAKANNNIGLRVWVDIYEDSMDDRGVSDDADMFSQTFVDVRSFLDTEVKYLNCYDVLTKICSQHFIIFYYLNTWNVLRVADLQRSTPMYYVLYNLAGTVIPSTIFTPVGDTSTAKIGQTESIFTHGEDFANKSIEFAQKEARVVFDYKIPENLVNNQKLTRLGNLIAPLSGPGYAAYQLVGWSQKSGTAWAQVAASLKNAYIKTEEDTYGYETQRYYVIEHDSTVTAGPLDNFIINDNTDFWVSAGDKLNVSFEHRLGTDIGGAGLISVALVAIWRDGTTGTNSTDWHFLDNDGLWAISSIAIWRDLTGAANGTDWQTVSVETKHTIPVNGRCFILLGTGDLSTPNEAHFKNLRIEYLPKIAGGYTEVRGDFNRYEQNPNYKNKIDENVFISDSPKRIIGGSLFDDTGTALLNPLWYRYGVAEQKRYTQLVAMGLYNLHYRKFRRIEGTFKGYDYEKEPGGATVPIGPMTKFEFTDTGEAKQYLCMNMRMNIKKGWFDGTFREIYDPATNDGDEVGDENEFNYLF